MGGSFTATAPPTAYFAAQQGGSFEMQHAGGMIMPQALGGSMTFSSIPGAGSILPQMMGASISMPVAAATDQHFGLCGCEGCIKAGIFLCSQCCSHAYCGAECQKEDWPAHKEQCKKTAAEAKNAGGASAAPGSMIAPIINSNSFTMLPQVASPCGSFRAMMPQQGPVMSMQGPVMSMPGTVPSGQWKVVETIEDTKRRLGCQLDGTEFVPLQEDLRSTPIYSTAADSKFGNGMSAFTPVNVEAPYGVFQPEGPRFPAERGAKVVPYLRFDVEEAHDEVLEREADIAVLRSRTLSHAVGLTDVDDDDGHDMLERERLIARKRSFKQEEDSPIRSDSYWPEELAEDLRGSAAGGYISGLSGLSGSALDAQRERVRDTLKREDEKVPQAKARQVQRECSPHGSVGSSLPGSMAVDSSRQSPPGEAWRQYEASLLPQNSFSVMPQSQALTTTTTMMPQGMMMSAPATTITTMMPQSQASMMPQSQALTSTTTTMMPQGQASMMSQGMMMSAPLSGFRPGTMPLQMPPRTMPPGFPGSMSMQRPQFMSTQAPQFMSAPSSSMRPGVGQIPQRKETPLRLRQPPPPVPSGDDWVRL